jgi:hypothetical protein
VQAWSAALAVVPAMRWLRVVPDMSCVLAAVLQVWVARAHDFDSKRFKNNMEVVGLVSSVQYVLRTVMRCECLVRMTCACARRHGLARVASGYWKPSHAFVLSPKAVEGAGHAESPVVMMSPAQKWNMLQARNHRAGAQSLVSDTAGREAVLPSAANTVTQFRFSGRFGVRFCLLTCLCVCASWHGWLVVMWPWCLHAGLAWWCVCFKGIITNITSATLKGACITVYTKPRPLYPWLCARRTLP